jgi:hypothetical protein
MSPVDRWRSHKLETVDLENALPHNSSLRENRPASGQRPHVGGGSERIVGHVLRIGRNRGYFEQRAVAQNKRLRESGERRAARGEWSWWLGGNGFPRLAMVEAAPAGMWFLLAIPCHAVQDGQIWRSHNRAVAGRLTPGL